LDQLESGEGLTVLAPNGQLLRGKQTAGLLLRGMPAKQVPVIIGGQSQGTMISCFVMQKNFVGWTAYNEPDQKFTPAKKYNFKAALLLSDFSAGRRESVKGGDAAKQGRPATVALVTLQFLVKIEGTNGRRRLRNQFYKEF
jgi:hypothetical protein